MTVPFAIRRSLAGPAGSRKLIERSEETSAVPAGSAAKTAPARAASATKASVPPAKAPAAVSHHGLAGIDHVEAPSEASSTTRPLRCVRGGAGNRRSANRRSWSTAGSANNPGCSRYANVPNRLLDDHLVNDTDGCRASRNPGGLSWSRRFGCRDRFADATRKWRWGRYSNARHALVADFSALLTDLRIAA